jgi:calcineurin-like phosphoesterase family protein
MSKIFLLGDTHIGLGYPNKTDKWFKVHQEYFSEFLIPLLKSRVKPGDIIVHLGDLFDNRNVIPINLMNYTLDIVYEISKIAPFHIIIGNHDLYSKSTSEINSVRPFKYINNVFIYDKPDKIEFNGINILMVPYIENRKQQISIINNNKDCKYLFCHSDLNGAKLHLTSSGHRNPDKIDIESFKDFRKVYSGHYHIVQREQNFTFVGSIFQMDRNDYGDQKGIFIIDTNDDSEEFIPNLISPVFKKVRLVNEDDIEELESLSESKDYIDIAISNNLLINNRKLRRKLEVILEKGGFASVEYIDDITKELEEGEEIDVLSESIDENNLDISIQLDYEDYIKEYILKQKYDNDKFKNGVVNEYDEIIKIYQDSYKNIKNED